MDYERRTNEVDSTVRRGGAAVYARIRECLEQRRYALSREVSAYPPPIPACDAHFNRLLEERGCLSEMLTLVDEAERAEGTEDDACRLAAGFAARGALDETLQRQLGELSHRKS